MPALPVWKGDESPANPSMITGRVFLSMFLKWLDREMGLYVPLIPTREPGLVFGRSRFLAPVGLDALRRTPLSSVVRLLPFQRGSKVFQICKWIISFLSFFSLPFLEES